MNKEAILNYFTPAEKKGLAVLAAACVIIYGTSRLFRG